MIRNLPVLMYLIYSQIIMDSLFDNKQEIQGLNKVSLKKSCFISIDNCEEIEGVTMGSPLAPAFANVLGTILIVSGKKNFPTSFKLCYCLQYVDILLFYYSRDYIKLFLDYFNAKHPNIKFTHKTESSGCLLVFRYQHLP